jgi:DNA-binding beta-propeller fold protein YncE
VINDDKPSASNIFSLNLTTNPISIATSTSLENGSLALALTPDGEKTYVADENGDIKVLKASDLSSITTIPNSEFESARARFIAISPTRPEAYVTTLSSTKVFVINTTTNHVTGSFNLSGGTDLNAIAITPTGSEVYVVNYAPTKIFYITLSDGTVNTITGMSPTKNAQGIAIAPDGTAVYAMQYEPNNSVLTKIDTSTHAVVSEFAIPSTLQNPQHLAITPDGKTVCITDEGGDDGSQFMAFINTTTGSSSTLQLTTSLSSQLGIAITPDQAPTARFTPTVSGTTVTFDASASSSPIGSIATYAWDFGDGQTATTTSPTTAHTYSTSGTFTVTLTVTNTAGTSTELTFTGQTASNNGGPSAVTTQQITAQTTAIDSFKGKVHRDHKEKKVYLKTKWTKSLVPNAKKYEIFARDTKIATIKANHKRHQTLHLHPHHFPHKISKDYRHYLEHKYNIRVVDSLGHISQPTFVHVVKH